MSSMHLTEYQLWRSRALQSGLSWEEAQECAQECSIQQFQQISSVFADPDPRLIAPKLRFQFILSDSWRIRKRLQRVEVLFTVLDEQERDSLACLSADSTADPVRCAIQSEFWNQMHHLCLRLAARPRYVFWQHYRHEKSIPEIAADIGRTANATHQILLRANRQMHRLMNRKGWNEALMRDYAADCRAK